MNSLHRRWEGLKENLFGLFYVMTEQKNQRVGGHNWSVLRCGIIYLVDAGQFLKALVLTEYGWSSEVINFAQKFDVIALILDLVIQRLLWVDWTRYSNLYCLSQIPHPYIPRGICFVIAVACVAIILVDVVLVLRIFQVDSALFRLRAFDLMEAECDGRRATQRVCGQL